MLPLLVLPLLLAAQQPVDGNVPRPGYVPPVLKGVEGEGRARHADQPIPFPDRDEAWQRVTTRHFVLISAAGDRRTRQIAEDLETLAAALGKLNGRFAAARRGPTRIYVFGRQREAQPYFDMLTGVRHANVSGLFVSQKKSASIVMVSSFGPRADRTAFHELVHELIDGQSRPPLWLDEGLAEYFGNAELRNGSIYAGGPIAADPSMMKRRADMPLRTMFAVDRDSDAYNAGQSQAAFYARSRATVDWLMRNGGRDRAAFYAFFHDIESGVPVETALQSRYGKSIDDLERALGLYPQFAKSSFGMTMPVPDTDRTMIVTPLDRATTLYELGSFLAGMEEMARDAERHFRAALDDDPHLARALAALAVLRASARKDDEAAALFEQALAADPADGAILLDYAEALLGNEIGPLAESEELDEQAAPRFRKARGLAQRALELGADRGRALGDLGTSYIVEAKGDLGPGMAALERARALLPARMDFALHLLSMLRRSGETAKAEPLFAMLDGAHSVQVKFAARAIVLRAELARTNELLRAERYEEAAAALRALAANSSDPDARRDFERQAADIARTGEANRQITVYNSAVALVNKGEYAKARQTLTSLLATATDAGVIRDAQKLVAELKGRKNVK